MKEVLIVQRQLKKDQIVDTASRMIKETSFASVNGMSEIGTHWLTEMDKLLFQLQDIENQIATP